MACVLRLPANHGADVIVYSIDRFLDRRRNVMSRRMDEDLRFRVVNFLVQRNMSSLRRIGVEAQDGLVTLRGNVRSFYEKQLCLNCVRHVAGVIRLVDQIEVAK